MTKELAEVILRRVAQSMSQTDMLTSLSGIALPWVSHRRCQVNGWLVYDRRT